MISQTQSTSTDIIYPDSDGKPMANNTVQFRWIVEIKENLDWLFADNPNVFVAGDLFWYPVEGSNTIVTAPDVMVVIGRPKGDRGSYRQWDETGVPPQVVFEILSPSNDAREMQKKLLFYDRYGVEEYYIYDPDTNQLEGWLRNEIGLDIIDPIANWVSPRLGIRFDLNEAELHLFRPDGTQFLSYTEIAQLVEQEHIRAEQERTRAEQAEQALAQERARSEALAAKLRALGIDPNQSV